MNLEDSRTGRFVCRLATHKQARQQADEEHEKVVSNQQDNRRRKRKHEEFASWLIAEGGKVLRRYPVERGVSLCELYAIFAMEDQAAGRFGNAGQCRIVDFVLSRGVGITYADDMDRDASLAGNLCGF